MCLISSFIFLFRVLPAAYADSQARGWIRALAAGLSHHKNSLISCSYSAAASDSRKPSGSHPLESIVASLSFKFSAPHFPSICTSAKPRVTQRTPHPPHHIFWVLKLTHAYYFPGFSPSALRYSLEYSFIPSVSNTYCQFLSLYSKYTLFKLPLWFLYPN